ncbi:MAG: ABC transporter ATP-binding protein [Clostridiales bacterium]|nr:ABC transporter ATP-binding protein [Clostridiales bacterium]
MEKNTSKVKPRSTVSWVVEFAGTKKSYYVASIVLAILSVAFGFLPYIFIGRIVKELLSGNADSTFCYRQLLFVAICWVLNRLMHTISTALSHRATFEVLGNIRRRITKHMAKMPLGDVLSESSGTYKNIIIERVDSVETTMAHILPEVTSNLLIPIVVFVYMLTINWKLALLSLLSLPIGALFFSFEFIGAGERFQNTIDKTKALNDTAVEYINGIEVIKAFGKAKTSYAKFVTAAKEGADCFIEWMRSCNVYQNVALTMLPAQLLSLVPFAGWFYSRGWVSGSDAFMLIILALGLVSPFLVIANYLDDLKKCQVIIGEATSIIVKPELERPDKVSELPEGYDIELKNVHFAYEKEEVLHGVNLHIKEGTVNALVGPSGSGKSTIAKLIASFWDVNEGAILLGGVDIRKIPLDVYNQNIAYVSQDNYLFDETVMENIRMGHPGATDEQVIDAAKRCGCHDFIMRLEDGYQTICGGAGSHLSGGERQRISIARAMLKDAPVVILDEATAYTDPENEALVQKSVAKLVRGKTLIVIAHRLSTIASADNIILVNQGSIEACGKQEELLRESGLYRKMWDAHILSKEVE